MTFNNNKCTRHKIQTTQKGKKWAIHLPPHHTFTLFTGHVAFLHLEIKWNHLPSSQYVHWGCFGLWLLSKATGNTLEHICLYVVLEKRNIPEMEVLDRRRHTQPTHFRPENPNHQEQKPHLSALPPAKETVSQQQCQHCVIRLSDLMGI